MRRRCCWYPVYLENTDGSELFVYLRGEGFHSDRGERYSIFMRCEIIYEDDEMLTIHKPAGLATQSSSAWQADAVSELKNYLSKKGISYLGVIHRLDQPVEGLLVFAKTPEAATKLSKQLQQGTLNKKYLALVGVKPNPEEGELVDSLRKDGGRAQIVTGREDKFPDAKDARLSYHVIAREDEMSFPETVAVLEVQIETGRFHQIRAQLAHAGWPILGDQKYGDENARNLATECGIRTVALCAASVECRHPKTGKVMHWECRPAWLS